MPAIAAGWKMPARGTPLAELLAQRLCAPAPTPETLQASRERARYALAMSACRLCGDGFADAAGGPETSTRGRCAGCRRVRYCGTECQRSDWARHKAECRAWRAEADAAVVAAGGCPLGDIAAQEAAIAKWWAPEKSLAAVRAAAEGGDLAAQCVLGGCFNQGAKGAPKDDVQAVVWLRRSAAGNVARAQTTLGYMHERGEAGLAVDLAEAARLYALAAAQGHAPAQFNLGLCYKNGDGVEKNLTEAAKWFRVASLAGESSGMVELGRLHELGDGVEKDSAQAYAYYKVAALDYEDRAAKRRLAALLKTSSLSVIAKGDLAAVTLKADITADKKPSK